MEKNIKDYLHLYLGKTKCLWETVEGTTGCYGYVDVGTLSEFINGQIRCRPILRPLSDMTEDEVNTLWILLGLSPNFTDDNEENKYMGWTRRKFITEYFDRPEKWPNNEERFNFHQNVILINYLRRIFIDCDNLIESGLAIDATTLNAPIEAS